MPEPGKYDWESQDSLSAFLKGMKDSGCQTFYASVWSPPYWLKSNQSTVKGGTCLPEKYPDFAVFIADWIQGMKERHGISFMGVSPWNEPDRSAPWPSCVWTGEAMAEFIAKHLGPALKERSLETLVVVGEDGGGDMERCDPSLDDPAAAKYVGICAGHQYGGKKGPPPGSSPTKRPESSEKGIG
jgi:glucuronoarabinoxylan endo-1,4-beta-xylanase